MFSVNSNICFYILLCSGLCTTESKRLETTNEIKTEDKDDNLIKNNIIALIQSRMNKAAIKKSLDDFTMVRRKTHFSLPGIMNNGENVEKNKRVLYPIYRSNNVGLNNLIYPNYVATLGFKEYDNNVNEVDNNNDGPEMNSNSNEYEDLIDENVKNDMEYLYNKYKENNFINVLTPDQETELLKVLRKQTELINNIKRSKSKGKKHKADKKKNDKHFKSGKKEDATTKKKDSKDAKTTKKKESKDTKTTKKKESKDTKTTKKKESKDTKTTKKKESKDTKTTKKKESKDTKTTKKKESKDTKTTKKKESKDAKTTKKKESKATKEKESKKKKDKKKDDKKEKTKKPITTVKKLTLTLTTTTTTKKPTPKMPKPDVEFDELIAEYEKKSEHARKLPNYTPFTFETTATTQTTKPTTTTTTTTTRPSTVLTILNEMDVRSALRNNPYVKRILQMANRKRQKYLKESLIKIIN